MSSSSSQSIFATPQAADLLVLMQFYSAAVALRPQRAGTAGVDRLSRDLGRLSRHVGYLRDRDGHGDGPGDAVLDRLHATLADAAAGTVAQGPEAQVPLVDTVTDLLRELLDCSLSSRA